MGRRAFSLFTILALAGATAVVAAAPRCRDRHHRGRAARAFANDALVDLGADITLTDCAAGDGGSLLRESTNSDPVTLDGHGFTITQTCESNAVVQNSTAGLTVRNLTVTGGDTDGNGGGVFSLGDLTIEDSVLMNNKADGAGGGAITDGHLVVRRTSVVGNGAGKGGGGLLGNLYVTVTDSNVSENVNGGISTGPGEDAQLTVVNTTIHHNTLAGLGGGAFSGGDATLVYVTITDNTVNEGFANLYVNGELTSFGTVVTGPGNNANRLVGDGNSLGYNFSDDPSCKFDAPTDRMSAGDPKLGPLSNGGPTQSQLPLTGSPLLDVIPAADVPDRRHHRPARRRPAARGLLRHRQAGRGRGADTGSADAGRDPAGRDAPLHGLIGGASDDALVGDRVGGALGADARGHERPRERRPASCPTRRGRAGRPGPRRRSRRPPRRSRRGRASPARPRRRRPRRTRRRRRRPSATRPPTPCRS